MELKIKIKETVEERRLLTDDEFWIFNSQGGVDYLKKNKGYVQESIIPCCGEQYTGVFRKEKIRDATTDEFLAWVVVILNEQKPEYEQSITLIAGLSQCTNEYTLIKADKILEDKEIIPELF